MSNTKQFNSLFKQRLKSNKFFLYLISLAVLVMDIAVAVIAILSQVGVIHWIIPLIFAVLDAVLLFAVYFSNFRFKYSGTIPTVYAVITFVLSLISILLIGFKIFTRVSAVMFFIAHAFPIIVLIISVRNASKTDKKTKNIPVLCLAIILAVFSFVYAIFNVEKGFYGQGSADVTRNLVYELDSSTDTYTVTGVLDGKGDKIVVPEERNGKKISAIDGVVFSDKTVSEIYLNCGADVKLLPSKYIENTNIKVYIDKSEVDTLKYNLISRADEKEYFIHLANNVCPSGLAENEVYITFAYTVDSLEYTQGELIPTWIGERGERFSLAEHAKNVNYADDYDPDSEEFLYKSYQNGNKVLCHLMHNGSFINKTLIKNNCDAVPVKFENVYAISFANSNDTMYEFPESFRQYKDGYRYVLSSDPGDLLGKAQVRDGFDLTWQCDSGSTRINIGKLTDILRDGNIKTVYPVWQLQSPIINEIKTENKLPNQFVYGDNITMVGSAQAPIPELDIEYKWILNNNQLSGINTYSMGNVEPNQSGKYTLQVTASNPAITSLTSTSVASLNIEIGRRPIELEWSHSGDLIYSGTDIHIYANIKSGQLINGDIVNSRVDQTSIRNAGRYNIYAELQGDRSHLYCIKEGYQGSEINIKPYELTLTWTDTEFTYDGQLHCPTASANGVGDERYISLPVSVSGSAKNASDSLKATATLDNSNYKIVNKDQPYTIAKRNIQLVWDTVNSFVYNAQTQHTNVSSVVGAVLGEEYSVIAGISYEGAAKNVGTAHTVTAVVNNNNYNVVSGDSTTYAITPKPLEVSWDSNKALTYNGSAQHVVATLNGVISGDSSGLKHTTNTQAVNCGSYSVQISITNENYMLPANISCSYTIVPKQLQLNWQSNTDLVYNGAAQKVNAQLAGVVNGETVELIYSNYASNINKGNYSVSVSINNANYVLPSNTSCSYKIVPKELTLTWDSNKSLVYNGSAQKVNATLSGMVMGQNVALSYHDWQSNINKGDYTVRVSITADNYVLPSNSSCSYKIVPKVLTLTWDNNRSFTYNGNAQKVNATVSGMIGADSVNLSYSNYSNNINVGTHSVSVSINNANYSLPSNSSCSYSITPKQLTLIWNGNREFTYNGNAQWTTATVSGAISGETVTLNYDASNNINADTYTVKATVSNSNYTLPSNNTCTYTIKPKELNVTWNSSNVFTYDGTPKPYSANISGNIAGDNMRISYTYMLNGNNVNGVPTAKGTYTVQITVANNNYKVVGNTTATYTIQ